MPAFPFPSLEEAQEAGQLARGHWSCLDMAMSVLTLLIECFHVHFLFNTKGCSISGRNEGFVGSWVLCPDPPQGNQSTLQPVKEPDELGN